MTMNPVQTSLPVGITAHDTSKVAPWHRLSQVDLVRAIQCQASLRGICGEQNGTVGPVFLPVFQHSPRSIMPPRSTLIHSSISDVVRCDVLTAYPHVHLQ